MQTRPKEYRNPSKGHAKDFISKRGATPESLENTPLYVYFLS